MEQHMPLIIYDSMQPGNLAKIAQGEDIGTKIS
jgi:uridylate kinase